MTCYETKLTLMIIKKMRPLNQMRLYTGFYALDYNLNDEEIKYLASHGIVKETGNTRFQLIRVGRNKTINAEIKEWKVDYDRMWHEMDYYRDLAFTMESIVDCITGCPEFDEE